MENKEIVEKGLEKLKVTLEKIKEFYQMEGLSNSERSIEILSLNQYFSGIAEMMELISKKEYHWSTTDKKSFRIVTIDTSDNEETIYTL